LGGEKADRKTPQKECANSTRAEKMIGPCDSCFQMPVALCRHFVLLGLSDDIPNKLRLSLHSRNMQTSKLMYIVG
ncbi:MAG: hypothetical protein PVJ35_15680, partial [Desulfobacterales bacterium]